VARQHGVALGERLLELADLVVARREPELELADVRLQGLGGGADLPGAG